MTCSQRYLIAAGTETEFGFLCKADSPIFYGFDVCFFFSPCFYTFFLETKLPFGRVTVCLQVTQGLDQLLLLCHLAVESFSGRLAMVQASTEFLVLCFHPACRWRVPIALLASRSQSGECSWLFCATRGHLL